MGDLTHESRHSHGGAGFPITAVAIIGIVATAFLLLTYYIFVIKCCLNWQRFSFSRTRRIDDPFPAYSPAAESRRRGLDQSTIRSIPVLQYKRGEIGRSDSVECSVCLNEFQETEKVRVIPNCGHSFHIDCIDIWLQNNPNCPLCRNPISGISQKISSFHHNHQDPSPNTSANFTGRDEEYVVIEIGGQNGNFNPSPTTLSISPSLTPKVQQKPLQIFSQSFGDECVDICRQKDERFEVKPIRRCLSMNSAVDSRQKPNQVEKSLV